MGRISMSKLEEVYKQCSEARFVVEDDKYYSLTLCMHDGQAPFCKKIIISGMHKLMRQHESGKLMYLLGCFFTAVAKDKGNPQTGSFMSVISRVIGRLGTIVAEEGVFILMDEQAQQKMVSFAITYLFVFFYCILFMRLILIKN